MNQRPPALMTGSPNTGEVAPSEAETETQDSFTDLEQDRQGLLIQGVTMDPETEPVYVDAEEHRSASPVAMDDEVSVPGLQRNSQ